MSISDLSNARIRCRRARKRNRKPISPVRDRLYLITNDRPSAAPSSHADMLSRPLPFFHPLPRTAVCCVLVIRQVARYSLTPLKGLTHRHLSAGLRGKFFINIRSIYVGSSDVTVTYGHNSQCDLFVVGQHGLPCEVMW